MKLLNKSESKIVILACIFTVISVLGFVLMQGNIKSKGNEYVSKKSKLKEIELTTDDYELIKRDKKDNENIFIVLEKRNLTLEESAYLVSELGKKSSGKFKVYLFNDKEKARDFEYETEQIQTVAKPIDSEKVEIEEYHIINKEIKDKPQYYAIKSINKKDGKTKVEIDLEDIDKPEKVLAQIKFLGDNIRNLNRNKDLGSFEIKAYYDTEKSSNWLYTSKNKNLIIHNQIVEK
ncbi:Uncharacterised protein [[Clostridium] sordellii]|uniref:hypothetical protein n=1 Tax=Paraclostridium sordellii TaxID=1505 RepID=UPI0005E0A10D|nr:hypothetical protein [Paeniclostridium sordellii]MCR1849949.1 hypothetical protein [Paeniclostridium sordellii]CEN76530.1 Uncharacterised protein [[Clostridium] sordellii] [Paeniclostridium sordellii]